MREKGSRRLFMITLYLRNGLKQEFWSNYTKVALDRHASWLGLDEVDWVHFATESVYGGSVYFKSKVEWVSYDPSPAEEWENSDEDESTDRDALIILKWADVQHVRLVFKEPGED